MKPSLNWCKLLSEYQNQNSRGRNPPFANPFQGTQGTWQAFSLFFFDVTESTFLKSILEQFSEGYFHLDIQTWDTSAFVFPPRTHLCFHHTIASSLNYSKIFHGYENSRHHMASILTMTTSHTTELKVKKSFEVVPKIKRSQVKASHSHQEKRERLNIQFIFFVFVVRFCCCCCFFNANGQYT